MKNFKVFLALILGLAPINFEARATDNPGKDMLIVFASLFGAGALYAAGSIAYSSYLLSKADKIIYDKHGNQVDNFDDPTKVMSDITKNMKDTMSLCSENANLLASQDFANKIVNMNEAYLEVMQKELKTLANLKYKGTDYKDRIIKIKDNIKSVKSSLDTLKGQISSLPESSPAGRSGLAEIDSIMGKIKSGSKTLKGIFSKDLPTKIKANAQKLAELIEKQPEGDLKTSLMELRDLTTDLINSNINFDQMSEQDFSSALQEVSTAQTVTNAPASNISQQKLDFLKQMDKFNEMQTESFLQKLVADEKLTYEQIEKFKSGKLAIGIEGSEATLLSDEDGKGIKVSTEATEIDKIPIPEDAIFDVLRA